MSRCLNIPWLTFSIILSISCISIFRKMLKVLSFHIICHTPNHDIDTFGINLWQQPNSSEIMLLQFCLENSWKTNVPSCQLPIKNDLHSSQKWAKQKLQHSRPPLHPSKKSKAKETLLWKREAIASVNNGFNIASHKNEENVRQGWLWDKRHERNSKLNHISSVKHKQRWLAWKSVTCYQQLCIRSISCFT